MATGLVPADCWFLTFARMHGNPVARALGWLWELPAYVLDVTLRRMLAARRARRRARLRGLPMLNVGAGGESFTTTLYGDVNVDLHPSPGVVVADVQDLPFPDGAFGAVFASHIFEHVEDPDRARFECERVSSPDDVFVVTPSWWAPHTWFYEPHLWYFSDGHGGGERIRL